MLVFVMESRWEVGKGGRGRCCCLPQRGGLPPGFGQVVALGAQQKRWSWWNTSTTST